MVNLLYPSWGFETNLIWLARKLFFQLLHSKSSEKEDLIFFRSVSRPRNNVYSWNSMHSKRSQFVNLCWILTASDFVWKKELKPFSGLSYMWIPSCTDQSSYTVVQWTTLVKLVAKHQVMSKFKKKESQIQSEDWCNMYCCWNNLLTKICSLPSM